jgi:heme/copper-type cytochrome/quinol oxidase subunit 2
MANFSDLGRLLLIAGGAIVLLGLVLLLVGRIPFFGRLPGDISIQRGNTTFFFPVVTCLMLSVVLTVVVNLLLFLLRRR